MTSHQIERQKKVYAFILCLFLCMISIGAYYEINKQIIGLFLILSFSLLCRNVNAYCQLVFRNTKLRIWIVYVILGCVTTLFNMRIDNVRNVFIDVSFLFIAITLLLKTDAKHFLIAFERIILINAIIILITIPLGVDLFYLLKMNTIYNSVDGASFGGISALFEYRHYYGLFLVSAWIIEKYYACSNRIKHIAIQIILLLNIILTHTLNTWIIFLLCFLLIIVKKRKIVIKKRTVKLLLASFPLGLVLLVVMCDYWYPVVQSVFAKINNSILLLQTYPYGGVRPYVIRFGTEYMFTNSPIRLLFGGGHGFAMSWLKENPYGEGQWTAAIDVQYVSTLMNTGILGLMCISYLILREFVLFFKCKKAGNAAIHLIILATASAMLFFDIFETCTSVFVFWTVLICMQGEVIPIINDEVLK